MAECHLRNNHPLHSVLVPLWFLGLDNWASNTLPSLRKNRHWCSHTVLPVQAQPYGLAAGRLQSVHCFVRSGLIIVNMKASSHNRQVNAEAFGEFLKASALLRSKA